MNINERQIGETYANYRKRLHRQNSIAKGRISGVFWDSYRKGTYRKPKKGVTT